MKSSSPQRFRRRVLIVDDNPEDREMTRRLLAADRECANEVVEATSGEEAIDLLVREPFDAMVLDNHMPEMSGIDVLLALRERAIDLPVVLMTGTASGISSPMESLEAGALDYVVKDDVTSAILSRSLLSTQTRFRLRRDLAASRAAAAAAAEQEREARQKAELMLAEVAQARDRIAHLQELTATLAKTLTTAEVASAISSHSHVLAGADGGVISVVEEGRLRLVTAFGYTALDRERWSIIPMGAPVLLAEAARERRPLWIASRAELTQRFPILNTASATEGEGSWAGIPLEFEGRTLGALGLRFPAEVRLTDDDRVHVESCALQLGQALERARLYEESRSAAAFEQQLLAVVSHDLRTPLAAIMMASGLLSRPNLDASRLASISTRIRSSADRMAHLVDDLLDVTQRRLGRTLSMALSEVDIGETCREQIEELRQAFHGREITFEVRGNLQGTFDPRRIGQIVANLVRNALNHGAQKAPVSVKLVREGGDALLTVHNQGNPIPPEVRGRLFEPFVRGSGAQAKGVGLGLFIVREIALASRGSVSVDSGEGGTTFCVRLPLAAPLESVNES